MLHGSLGWCGHFLDDFLEAKWKGVRLVESVEEAASRGLILPVLAECSSAACTLPIEDLQSIFLRYVDDPIYLEHLPDLGA